MALPIQIRPALAVGSDLKNTFCVGAGGYGWLSAHVGDMDDLATLQAFDIARDHLEKVTGVQPEMIIADQHPAIAVRPGHGRTPATAHWSWCNTTTPIWHRRWPRADIPVISR